MAGDRYNNMNNTAPEVDPTKQKKPNIDKSDFNLNCPVFFKAIDGAIVPFDCFRVIPNSTYDLSYNLRMIMTNPYVKQILSGKRAYVHVYHSNLFDLWEGATEFMKKGRDFNSEYKIPTLKHIIQTNDHKEEPTVVSYETITAGSPAAYLGLPVARYDTSENPLENIKPIALTAGTEITNYDNLEISALKLVMYQQIYAAHYLNKNLINSNKEWLPQVENHLILPLEASGQSVARLSYDVDKAKDNEVDLDEDFDFNSEYFVPADVESGETAKKSNAPLLNVLRFRQFKGDMFTSGSPFPDLIRGDVPVLSFSDLTSNIDWSAVIADESFQSANAKQMRGMLGISADNKLGLVGNAGGTDRNLQIIGNNSMPNPTGINIYNNSVYNTSTYKLKDILDKAVVTVQATQAWSLNQLRALDVYTLLGERAARTDGTYNDYIKTMFGVNPNVHMHEPRYLGGFYLDMVNQTIEQTSETANSPLGTTASKAISNGSSHIGKFSFNDHGYIMAVFDIVDETVYTGGVDRDWTDLDFESQYLPLFNGLAPQATLQQELFLTGVKADNEAAFNYVERYSHLKSRRAKAVGQMSLPAYKGETPIDIESAAYLHTRNFESAVTFNNLFVTMTPKNIDMTPYSNVNDYPFLVTAECYNDAVLPLPYITVPNGLNIMA